MHHLSLLIKSAGARSHQKTENEPETRADADDFPRIFVNVLIGVFRGLARLGHDGALDFAPGIFTRTNTLFDLVG